MVKSITDTTNNMSDEYTRTSFTLKNKTYENLVAHCPELVPLSRYLNQILEKEFSKK